MLLTKSFFRKKTTKIYLMITSILLISIVILFQFIDYYSSLNTTYFENNSFILIVGKTNYENILKNNSNVSSYENALLFNPNYSYEILKKEKLEGGENSNNELNIYWEDLFIKHPNLDKGILAFSDESMVENEVALVMGNALNSPDLEEIVSFNTEYSGKKISFYNNAEKVEFIIKNINKSNFPEVGISADIFQQLSKQKEIFTYKVVVGSAEKANQLVKQLKSIAFDEENIVSLIQQHTDNELDSIKLSKTINSLSIVSCVIIIVFLFLFLIILKNIMKDETDNIVLNRLLGYSKKQVRNYLIINILILNFMSFALSSVSSIILVLGINQLLYFKLEIFSLSSLIIYPTILISSILCFLMYKIPDINN